MIYIFKNLETISLIQDDSVLSEKDKQGALAVVNELPKQDIKEGYFPVLALDENNKPYWKYEKAEASPEIKVRLGMITKEEYKNLTGKDFTF
jgi:hypothetical protein